MRSFAASTLLLVASLLAACDGPQAEQPALTVAAAISLKDALAEITKGYRAAGGGPVEFTYGSSGQLATQIRGGAPVDIFVSAAHQQVDDLGRAGLVDSAAKQVVAGNRLVVIVPASSPSSPALSDLRQLGEQGYARVAIGEPRTVPAGQYAEQAMRSVGIADRVRARLVYGANVRQVLDYVRRGEVNAGIVYATDARQAGDAVRVALAIDPAAHDPVEYPAVVVKATKHPGAAARFLKYLSSARAREVFAAHGFTTGAQRP